MPGKAGELAISVVAACAPLGRREVEVSRALTSRALKRNDMVACVWVCVGEGPSTDILLLERLSRAGRRTVEEARSGYSLSLAGLCWVEKRVLVQQCR